MSGALLLPRAGCAPDIQLQHSCCASFYVASHYRLCSKQMACFAPIDRRVQLTFIAHWPRLNPLQLGQHLKLFPLAIAHRKPCQDKGITRQLDGDKHNVSRAR